MTGTSLRVGIVGCGVIGRKRAEALRPGDRLIACADVVGEAAERLASDFGGRVCGDVEELLELAPETLRKLRDNLLLFYTGEARDASAVLGDQDERSKSGDEQMIANLHATKEMGYRFEELLLQGDLEGYAELMNEHWENKRRRSPGMSSEHIDTLYTLARRSGAIGGKLVGAGGGGFLLVYARRPADTRQAMAAAGAQELVFDFEFGGAVASEYA